MVFILKVMKYLTLLIITIFISCSKEEQKIVIWESYNEVEHSTFIQILKGFQEKNNIKVEVIRMEESEITKRLLQRSKDIKLPDIVSVNTSILHKLVYENSVVELTNLCSGKISNEIFGISKIGKTIYGIPDIMNFIIFFYNKKKFEEKNLSIPHNLDELYNIAKELTDKSKGCSGLGICLDLSHLIALFNSFGAKILYKEKFILNSEECIKTISYIKKLYDEKILNIVDFENCKDIESGFINGKYSMILGDFVSYKKFIQKNIDFDIFLMPSSNSEKFLPVTGNVLVLLKDSKNYYCAIKFLTYFVSKDIQSLWSEKILQLPLNKDSEIPENLKIIKDHLKNIYPLPLVKNYDIVQKIMSEEIILLLKENKEIKKILDNLTKKINNEMLIN